MKVNCLDFVYITSKCDICLFTASRGRGRAQNPAMRGGRGGSWQGGAAQAGGAATRGR